MQPTKNSMQQQTFFLHFFSSISHFPSKHPNFPSPSCPRNLPFHPLLSSKCAAAATTISLPSTPLKSPQIPSISPPLLPPHNHHHHSDFQEKLLFLDSLGIDLLSLLAAHPPIVSVAVDDLKSTVDFLLHSVNLTASDLHRVVSMCPEILTICLNSLISVVTFLLREAGVEGRHLRYVIHRRPRLLTCDVSTRLRPTLYFLQGTISLSQVNKHTSLLSCSVEQKLIPRIEFFQNVGFSRKEAIAMFRKFPSLFCYSIQENFEPKFNYFVVEMGRELTELKEFPHYFSFSLENRIKPRHQKCVDRGVCLSLPVMLKSNEKRFLHRLEVCCNSSLPVRNSPLWCINANNCDVNVTT